MIRLQAEFDASRPLRLLCLGAHSDDLEIGYGGTLFNLLKSLPAIEATWAVLAGGEQRIAEARKSAKALLRGASAVNLAFGSFRDGYFPGQYSEIKSFFEDLKGRGQPEIIYTHCLEERHQDHRLVAELTWNTWREHLIYEYEIPKYEGGLPQPNAYVCLGAAIVRRKLAHIDRLFASQRGKNWFRAEVCEAQMVTRGIERRAPSGFAEAFHARKSFSDPVDARVSQIRSDALPTSRWSRNGMGMAAGESTARHRGGRIGANAECRAAAVGVRVDHPQTL